MKPHSKPSIASHATVRSLIVACLPTAAVALAASSSTFGAEINEATHSGLSVEDNAPSSTNGSSTNSPGLIHHGDTNSSLNCSGIRQ